VLLTKAFPSADVQMETFSRQPNARRNSCKAWRFLLNKPASAAGSATLPPLKRFETLLMIQAKTPHKNRRYFTSTVPGTMECRENCRCKAERKARDWRNRYGSSKRMPLPTEKFLRFLGRIVRPISIQGLPLLLVAAQAFFWLGGQFNPAMNEQLVLTWDKVLAGEVWRIFSFVLVAPAGHPLFAIFYFYILYMMGNFLEQTWGTVRFCSFVYLGLFLNVLAGLAVRDAPISGTYMYSTIFLAFATFNPNFTFMIMFVLPVKVKYLAWLQAAGFLLMIFGGPLSVSLMVVVALGNYVLFFADMLINRGTGFHRRMKWQAKVKESKKKPVHTCIACGIDSNTDRNMDFRYCSQCTDTPAYCEQHLRDHEHI